MFTYSSIVSCLLFGMANVGLNSTENLDRFSACPDSPNCVSSLSDNKKHFIEPFKYTGSLEDARQKLINILENTRRARLVTIGNNYTHAESRSFIFRFVDDVEFFLPAGESIIHVKSASRSGYYDFGANRRRVERFRAAFENRENNHPPGPGIIKKTHQARHI